MTLGAASQSRPTAEVGDLLKSLVSSDPRQRTEAGLKLIAQGAAARPAIVQATRAADPELRARASDLLMRLSWMVDSDPADVKSVLGTYGSHDQALRMRDIGMLAGMKDSAGFPVMVRLLQEDPSDAVRWAIVSELPRDVGEAAAGLDQLRAIEPADQPAPVVAAVAYAWQPKDLGKSKALYQLASDRLAGDPSPELHLIYGQILANHGLRTLAQRELKQALAGPPESLSPLFQANAHLQLALAIGDDDDQQAANHIEKGIDAFERAEQGLLTLDQQNVTRTGNDALSDLKAEMHWRYYRAAKKENRRAEAAKQLNQLLEFNPQRADVILEIVPTLKELGRTEEAKTLFNRAYLSSKEAVEAAPGDVEAANNLAWLCARCDERLDEAKEQADRSMKGAPENAAYLDTAAEVQFHMGHAQAAADLERRALKLRPSDEFMQGQLKRFEAGAAAVRPKNPK